MAKYNSILGRATDLLDHKRETYKERRVQITMGKYKGREGVCRGVTIGETYNRGLQFKYCIYVLRKDGAGILNTDGESRSFRTDDEFEWI